MKDKQAEPGQLLTIEEVGEILNGESKLPVSTVWEDRQFHMLSA